MSTHEPSTTSLIDGQSCPDCDDPLIARFLLARDVLGDASAHKMNDYGGHEWAAVAAVRRACSAGRAHHVVGVLISEAERHAPQSARIATWVELREILALAKKFHRAQVRLDSRARDRYLAEGMAVCNADDVNTAGAAAVLVAAVQWALALGDADQSVCVSLLEEAARKIVIQQHQSQYLLDPEGFCSASNEFRARCETAAAATSRSICARVESHLALVAHVLSQRDA